MTGTHFFRLPPQPQLAAKELNELRERWLNPPEWIEQVAAKVDAVDDFADVPAKAAPSSAAPPSWPSPPKTPGSRNAR